MTTTLRPLEPERLGQDSRRIRRYVVCVNSRRVGDILIGARPFAEELTGEVSELRIDEPDRRRGRATVAALAAEEVLRQWGCTRVRAAVPGGSDAGLGLATALGYVERNRQMARELPAAPPSLPDGLSARPMTDAEYPAWLEHERSTYTREWVAAGLSEPEARAKSEADYRTHRPDGPKSAQTVLRVLAAHGTDVGTLWVALRGPGGPGEAWVFSVEVAEAHRGRGYGRALMLLAEAECAAAGIRKLGLNVFADNTPAVRLYESLGYQVVTRYLVKPLL